MVDLADPDSTPAAPILNRGYLVGTPLQTDIDAHHLARSIELAERGRGWVSPNPLVGAVIASDAEVCGEGFHAAVGGPHAERVAIAACGLTDLTGATLYVSLEPCCHYGRTPPCTEAILQAGLRRVVVASDDPSAKAAGRGLGILRDEGVDVRSADGELCRQARLLNQPFRKHARTGRPHVTLKMAMTLDGRVATAGGDSRWISGEESRARVHRRRAEVDAIAVGIGTAEADDPRLTARFDGAPRQPRRVVFDSTARLSTASALVRQAPDVALTVVVSRAAPRPAVVALEAAGAEVLVAAGEHQPARVRSALDALGAVGITSLLLEGGPRLAGAFHDAAEIDELELFVAPLLIGAVGARAPLEGTGTERIVEGLRAADLRCERSGDDLLLQARLREW